MWALDQIFFFLNEKEINTFIQQGYIELVKHDRKYICNVTKISISFNINAVLLNFLLIQIFFYISFHKPTKQHNGFSTLIIIRNVFEQRISI